MEKRVLLLSLNAEEIKMQLSELLSDVVIMTAPLEENDVYHFVRKKRPRYVLIDACLPDKTIELVCAGSEKAKWDFDITMDTLIVGNTPVRIPRIEVYNSFEKAAEVIKNDY